MQEEESFADTIKTLVYAILIAVLIRTFLFEPFKIPSGSMYPSLYVGDFLFVSKYTYGYSKHSFPFSIPLFEGRIWSDEPKRGDVVVFKFPRDNHTDYIKRIIGLPGENIEYKDNYLYIDGKKYQETIYDNMKTEDFTLEEIAGVDKIPDDMYLVLGDNRGNSQDSRDSKIGLIKKSDIIGRTFIRIWPLNGIKLVK